MQVELVSPERILFSGEAAMVVCRTLDGEIAFMANHAPLIGLLGVGPVRIYNPVDQLVERAAVHGGFVEVSNNRVTILSDVAELAGSIDAARAAAARDRAQAEIARQGEPSEETVLALRRAEVRLELAQA